MALGARLRCILATMGTAARLADIGTDHALLPIAAVREGRAASAVATDLRPEPLAAARRAVVRAGLEGRIELRLGYGLRPLRPGEADVVVIAGLHGDTIAHILRDRPGVLWPGTRLLLMPVRRAGELRRCLRCWGRESSGAGDPGAPGLELRAERLAREGRHVYALLEVAVLPAGTPRDAARNAPGSPGAAGDAPGAGGGRLPVAAEQAARELAALAEAWGLPPDAACDTVGPSLLVGAGGGPDPLLREWLEELARPWRRAARVNPGSTARAGRARETAERWLGFLGAVGQRWAE